MTDEQYERIEAARAAAEAVLARARADTDYCAELRADPVAVLTAGGLTDQEATHLSEQEFDPDDVQGMRVRECNMYTWKRACDTISCIVSICADVPNTNYVP